MIDMFRFEFNREGPEPGACPRPADCVLKEGAESITQCAAVATCFLSHKPFAHEMVDFLLS